MERNKGSGMRRAVVSCVGVLLAGAALGGVASAAGGALSTQGIVAFTGPNSAPGVWLVGPDGSGRHLLTPSGENWIADDVSRGHASAPITVLARPAYDNTKIYAIRADGAGSPILIHQATYPARATFARFSRDGSRVAFIGNTGVAPVVYSIYVGDVVRSGTGDVIGLSNVASVYDTSSQLFRGLDFNRAGTGIVFVLSYDLWLLALGSGTVTRLTNTPEVEAYPRCSSVDDRVVYEKWPSAGSMGNGGVICTLDVSTGAVQTITTKKNGGIAAAYLSSPCWSPDSAFVLYHAHDASHSDLWQISSVGSGWAVNVTNNGTAVQETGPAWGW